MTGENPVLFVLKQSRLNSIVGRSTDRTFYRMAGENAWIKEFSRDEIQRMKQVEADFDFSEIGYKNTSAVVATLADPLL